MRLITFRTLNTDPAIPASCIDYPMLVMEESVCSRDEELFRCEGFICEEQWDPCAIRQKDL